MLTVEAYNVKNTFEQLIYSIRKLSFNNCILYHVAHGYSSLTTGVSCACSVQTPSHTSLFREYSVIGNLKIQNIAEWEI